MHSMVVIFMQNPNALVTMATVSQNADNPFATFCEYLKYCIFANCSENINLDDLKEAVKKEFGIYIPHNIILSCLGTLEKEAVISQHNHQIKRIGVYDIDTFEQKRAEFRLIEKSLIDELIKFVSKFKLIWDYDYAKEQLIKVLDGDGLAYDVFVGNTEKRNSQELDTLTEKGTFENTTITDIDEDAIDNEAEEQPLFAARNFAGMFVRKTLNETSIIRDYLLKVCEGLMICAGVYQLPSANASGATPQIKGTTFFFDTRLLLRYIGCAGKAAVESTRELVAIIKANGGLIAYFPQTLAEIQHAFNEAIDCTQKRQPIRDSEMRLYATKVKHNVTVISAKLKNVEDELANDGIFLKPLSYHDDNDIIRYGFERSSLCQYMQSVLNWDDKVIENDALSIWETHMLRKGNYREYCGTNDHLCVFVTSNASLIGAVLGFHEKYPNSNGIREWKHNKIPVITDVRLTCRLWSPAMHSERISLLYLTANAVAAQRPTQSYINKIKEIVSELERQVPQYSSICLSEYFDDNITERILENTLGQEDNLNIGTFASTLEEFTEFKVKEQEEKTEKETEEKLALTKKLNDQTNAIINGAVDKTKNKMGIIKILLYLAYYWETPVAIIFAITGSIISIVSGSWHPLMIIAVALIVLLIEKFFTSNFIRQKMLKLFVPKAEKSYENKIIKSLTCAELAYKDTIIEKAKAQTKILLKCYEQL